MPNSLTFTKIIIIGLQGLLLFVSSDSDLALIVGFAVMKFILMHMVRLCLF